MDWSCGRARTGLFCAVLTLLLFSVLAAAPASAKDPLLARYLKKVTPAELAPGADAFGPIRTDLPVAPILKSGETIAHAFLTSDFVPTNGYSGKPIHIVAGVDNDAAITGVRLVKHYEPIVLIGIPDKRIVELTERYAGLDLKAEAASGGQRLTKLSPSPAELFLRISRCLLDRSFSETIS